MDGKLESDRESNGVYRQRSRSRSRSPVDHPKSHNFRDGKRSQGGPVPKRVYVTNIPYNCRWSDLKDLFRDKVGDVAYVDLFEDEAGRFKGNGIVEFNNAESVQKAIDVLNKFEYKGRPLYVKEDTIGDRVRGGGPGPMRGGGGGPMPRGMPPKYNPPMPSGGGGGPPPANFNTYGLSPKFLEYLGITGPLVSKVFVTNLSYRVDEAKLRDVFSIAGKVMRVDIKKDKDGQSKGLALVEFDHPVEAVQAISMFHDQKLFNRPMSIRMDRFVGNDNEPPKLPSGLSGIGKGLGTSGQPLQIPSKWLGLCEIHVTECWCCRGTRDEHWLPSYWRRRRLWWLGTL
ncbi:HNRNPM [Cordylochernes scorpioides]|uniref:HNRNPM n=1 Tax=Cordylochernes scorpioides TaxID=51811 RepID=A0ABY6K4A8_9ARAC|nr:HNRNPM [Cordylochernes scorpioides]